MSLIKAVKIDDEGLRVVEIDNGLQSLYKELNCDTIDIQERKVGRYHLQFVVDDEGLLKDGEKHIHAVSNKANLLDGQREMFVGNILITSTRGENLSSLTPNQIDAVKQAARKNGNKQDSLIGYCGWAVTLKSQADFVLYDF